MYGRFDAFKPWLLAAVVMMVLLRRAIPYSIAINDNKFLAAVVVVVGWSVAATVSLSFLLEIKPEEYGDPPMLVTGALFFLSGAVYAFGRAMHDAFRAMGKAS
jgi:hypothetical protein